MSEGISGPSGEGEKVPEAGGMPAQAVPTTKKFFLVEYIEEMRRGAGWLKSSPKPEAGIVPKVTAGFKRWSRLRKARVGMVVVLIIVGASYGLFSAQAGATKTLQGRGPVGPGTTGHNASLTVSGTVKEQGSSEVNETFNTTRFSQLQITLTWKDEPAPTLRTNQPDQLGFSVAAPNGANWTAPMAPNPQGGEGSVAWKLDDTSKDYGAGAWRITVEGGNMGDTVKSTGNPICFTGCSADTSNAWSLSIDYAW